MDQTIIDQIAAAVATSLVPVFDRLTEILTEPPPESAAPTRVAMARDPAPADADLDADPQAGTAWEIARLRDTVAFQNEVMIHQANERDRLFYELEFDRLEKEGVSFDRVTELSEVLDMAPERRPAHLARMRTQYRRSSIGRRDMILTANPEEPDGPLTAEESKQIIDFASKHKICEPNEARARYMAERRSRGRSS